MSISIMERLDALPLHQKALLVRWDWTSMEVAIQLKNDGFLQDVNENSLAQVLGRWRNKKKAEIALIPTSEEVVPMIPFDPMEEMLKLAAMQKTRVDAALAKEKEVNLPLDATNKVISEYQTTLALLQKMQIDADAAKRRGGASTGQRSTAEICADLLKTSNEINNREV